MEAALEALQRVLTAPDDFVSPHGVGTAPRTTPRPITRSASASTIRRRSQQHLARRYRHRSGTNSIRSAIQPRHRRQQHGVGRQRPRHRRLCLRRGYSNLASARTAPLWPLQQRYGDGKHGLGATTSLRVSTHGRRRSNQSSASIFLRGFSNVASGTSSIGLGASNTASGNFSFAIGALNKATGANSAALGVGNSGRSRQLGLGVSSSSTA